MSVHEFTPAGLGEGLKAALLRASLKAFLKPSFSAKVPVAQQRQRLMSLSKTALLPKGTRFEAGSVGGVPGEWVRLAERKGIQAPRQGTLLYLHGGAYCVGSAATHRNLTARLAQATGLEVFALDYRLAPEHPFPAAIEDARSAALALMQRGPLYIAGDSAGGGLAVATTLALRDGGHALPAALVLFSPWVDVTLKNAPPAPPPGEAMLSVGWAQACAAMYLHGADGQQPWASPQYAKLEGLPPVLIQCGTDELLYPEGLRFHDALQAARVAVRCEVTQRRWHVFQAHAGVLQSANEAVNRVGQFVAAQQPASAAAAVETREVVILGAGMSGLCMGIQLKQAGQHDFVMLEKSSGLGGTWWDNRYPGAHVDVPAPVYCFSFEANPRWRQRFAAAAEIQAYMEHCADKYRVRAHMQMGQSIASARFDDSTGRWRITTATGRVIDARFFVCSTGPLSQAKWPDIAGLESFAGPKLHSARWDAAVPLQGKRIAVIGTGSTASQLVPPLAEAASKLYVFQRTANWVLPRLDRPYNALDRWLAHVPPYARAVRALWYQFLEMGRRGFDEGSFARRRMKKMAAQLMNEQVQDPALRAQLTPPYALGCKRIIYSNDFYAALAKPQTELVTRGISHITPQAVVTDDGQEHHIDALVCATGFDVSHSLSSVQITGAAGRTLQEAWAGGPEAYRGVTVAGFPNFFLMLGPNTATGHTSTLLFIEPQVRFSIAAMQKVRDGQAKQISVRPEVHSAHNAALQARLSGSVWSQCRSWYRADDGKIIAIWPGFTAEYVQGLVKPNWDEFQLR
jgi:cation diffusion facilitator CzcD-associated flavoprotein CzcO/acetyl esterase/lipase